jgi:hypothetical protein
MIDIMYIAKVFFVAFIGSGLGVLIAVWGIPVFLEQIDKWTTIDKEK